MPFIEAPTNFYIGKLFDPKTDKMTDDVVYYESRDLTTHAVVVGMTGSGKTGLCISLLEEAILDNVPAIIIDPKGDISNLALVFPELRPQDFAPWLHEDDARRKNMTNEMHAEHVATTWREGLQGWGISSARLKWMQAATRLSIYTPGSDAGLPISILASLRAPRQAWQGNEEAIRERIQGVVTAIFALAGMNYQPTKDAQHVLLSNIIEYNWRIPRDLTLEDIIIQIKQPPFDRLGAFPIDQYMSERVRYKLATDLNNIIAAPTFQSWIQGEPLDIQNLLYQPNGRPKVSVFYTAHLSDQERMFITTLILESLIAWMRTQPGTSSLRALLYIDEMFGYFPPYPKNPPTKEPIMRLLKQARAFGIGLILATQNPGDLDYKGLTNAGTWFIGRLSSAQDKQRVMEGLQSIATASEALTNLSDLISDIKPRVFLMRNVHTGGPALVHSRWAMSYLAGPLTRQQISLLMAGQKQELMARQGALGQTGGFAPPPALGFNAPLGTSFAPPPPPPAFGGGTSGFPPPPPPAFGAQTAGFPPPAFGGGTAGFPPPPAFGAQTATGSFPSVNPSDASPAQASRLPGGFLATQPPVKSEIAQYFLPVTLSHQQAFARLGRGTPTGQEQLAYVPILFAQVAVRYQHRASQVYLAREYAYHVPDVQLQGLIHWEQYQAPVVDSRAVTSHPIGRALFQELPVGLSEPKRLTALQRELIDMVANTARLVIPYHPQLKLYADPNRDVSEFYAQVHQVLRERYELDLQKLSKRFGDRMDKLEEAYKRKEREYQAERMEIKDRQREQLYTTGEALLSIFKGRTNYTLSRMSRTTRMKRQTEADLNESRDVMGELERQMIDLEAEFERAVRELDESYARIERSVEEYTITPFKKDITMSLYGVGWVPHYYLLAGNQPIIVPAFG
jgi:hypothetical protein